MEELLNKLIEKGWKAFGRNYCKYEKGCLYYTVHTEDGVWSEGRYGVSLRELVSKESGLWQFVCENGLIKRPRGEAQDDVRVWRYVETMGTVWDRCFGKRKPEFYIIESSLKDESELEQFLLDNIKL